MTTLCGCPHQSQGSFSFTHRLVDQKRFAWCRAYRTTWQCAPPVEIRRYDRLLHIVLALHIHSLLLQSPCDGHTQIARQNMTQWSRTSKRHYGRLGTRSCGSHGQFHSLPSTSNDAQRGASRGRHECQLSNRVRWWHHGSLFMFHNARRGPNFEYAIQRSFVQQ
jgi:hypothetical protein